MEKCSKNNTVKIRINHVYHDNSMDILSREVGYNSMSDFLDSINNVVRRCILYDNVGKFVSIDIITEGCKNGE